MIKKLKKVASYAQRSFKTFALEATGKLPTVEKLFWEVTDACNSRCKHCNIWHRKSTKDILTVHEVEKTFSSGFFKSVDEVIISGGEPVLRTDLAEILLIMHKYIVPDAVISLSTNALLPDRVLGVTKTCLNAGMNLIVGVSLDGIGEKHDMARGVNGNFEKVEYLLHELSGLRKKSDRRLSVALGYTLSPETVDSMEEVRAYVESLGLDFIPQMYEEFSYYSNTTEKRDIANNEKLIKAVDTLPPRLQKEILYKCIKAEPLNYKCASMKTFFVLHCNGDVSPCLRYADICVGNLRDLSFEELWNSKVVKDARGVVKNCSGCSNTWATGWSLQYWLPPFLKMLSSATIKKEIARFKGTQTNNWC